MDVPTTVLIIARQATTTSATASATATETSPSGGDSSQTPFLYFIALGLGIVFTNLWVILGLKYCCRHRRRRMLGLSDSDSVNGGQDELAFYLNPIIAPTDIHRRRRKERKVLTMDELNTRFPVKKYSDWGAEREKEGLSATGGISSSMAEEVAQTIAKVTEENSDSNQEANHDGIIIEPLHGLSTGADKNPQSIAIDSDQIPQDDPSKADQFTNRVETENPPENIAASGNSHEPVTQPTSILSPTTIDQPPLYDNSIVNPTSQDQKRVSSHDVNFDEENFKEVNFNEAKFDEVKFEGPDGAEEPQALSEENSKKNEAEGDNSAHGHYNPDLEPSTSALHEHDEDSDDEFGVSLVPLNVDSPGDMCAICLDNIEPDSDIRGLTCGHVFHDECITPWLTSRRACCPLCKKDYFIKKPRIYHDPLQPEPTAVDPNAAVTGTEVNGIAVNGDNAVRPANPQSPEPVHVGRFLAGRRMIANHFRYGPSIGFRGHIDPTVYRPRQRS
jgi:hypothetical protein